VLRVKVVKVKKTPVGLQRDDPEVEHEARSCQGRGQEFADRDQLQSHLRLDKKCRKTGKKTGQ